MIKRKWILVSSQYSWIEKLDRKIRSKRQNKCIGKEIDILNNLYIKATEATTKYEAGMCYIMPRVNYGAGMGHQMACWGAGYKLSKIYGVGFINSHIWINGGHREKDDYTEKTIAKLIHISEARYPWDEVLGIQDVGVDLNDFDFADYNIIELPPFTYEDKAHMDLVSKIIEFGKNKKIVFLLAIDQFVSNTNWPTISELSKWFFSSLEYTKSNTIFSDSNYNVAIHIRRGDVDSSMPERYRPNDYYVNAIGNIKEYLREQSKTIKFYVISEGSQEDFAELSKLENVELLLSLDSKNSFVHLVYADAVLISPSGFATIAGAINTGMCFCPCEYKKFEDEKNWIYIDSEGKIMV